MSNSEEVMKLIKQIREKLREINKSNENEVIMSEYAEIMKLANNVEKLRNEVKEIRAMLIEIKRMLALPSHRGSSFAWA